MSRTSPLIEARTRAVAGRSQMSHFPFAILFALYWSKVGFNVRRAFRARLALDQAAPPSGRRTRAAMSVIAPPPPDAAFRARESRRGEGDGRTPLKAVFETAAEVLGALKKAFRDHEQQKEPAWRD
ncbi:hypothetical protein [Citreimonas salinaria]|uniref:hypothetical protein n=1 Tax=Citreimonas salinaria TaxID=321339 RepID=UPI0015A661FF|nr:hypothetical protein [Citreimonas salinaria]